MTILLVVTESSANAAVPIAPAWLTDFSVPAVSTKTNLSSVASAPAVASVGALILGASLVPSVTLPKTIWSSAVVTAPAPIAVEFTLDAVASLPIATAFNAEPTASAPTATPPLSALALLPTAIALLSLVLDTPTETLALFASALKPIAVAVGSPLSLAPATAVVNWVP